MPKRESFVQKRYCPGSAFPSSTLCRVSPRSSYSRADITQFEGHGNSLLLAASLLCRLPPGLHFAHAPSFFNLMHLSNQHVFITGGSSGIGLALAQQAAAAGARLSLVGRDAAKLTAAAQCVRNSNPGVSEIVTMPADVSSEAAVLVALQTAEAVHGPVDILITSAGVAHPGYFEELPASVFERTMAVNYFGTLYAIKAVVPGMRARGRGAVVLISSGAGLVGLFGYTAYAPSKFALRGLAEALRGELKPAGIAVTIVYPPDTNTPQLIEENLTKPPETKALTAGGGLWTAEAVARVTLNAVRSGRFSVTPGFQLTLLSWLHGLIAPILHWHFDRVATRTRRAADTKESRRRTIR